LRRVRSASNADLSKEEWTDLQALQKKQKEELNCAVSINNQSRIDAYEKYFRVKPSDYANHNFSKWSEAPKYLGRNFDDILVEEKFAESKMLQMTFLERSATANAPLVTLLDSPSKLRVVTSISLVSTPFPSDAFIQRLTKHLENTWGKPTGGNGSKEWLWNKDGFRARLVHEPVSAEGPFLSLSIDENN